MGLLGGEGFSLPVVTETEVVDVNLNFSEAAISALKQNMAGDEESHVLVISAQSGGCSGYLYDMKIIEDPGNDGFQRIDIGGIEVLVHNKDSTMLSGINIDFSIDSIFDSNCVRTSISISSEPFSLSKFFKAGDIEIT